MISSNLAKKIILQHTKPLASSERIRFLDSLGRVLAEDTRATSDLPPFSRATVDGFAIKSINVRGASKEHHVWLKIVDVVQAGRPSKKKLHPGEAIKIMTGGVIPAGTDCVIMKEFTECGKKSVCVFKDTKPGEGISFQGESAKKGSVLLKKGNRISAGVVSLLATLGLSQVSVYKKPKVAILVTGNELLNVNQKLSPGKIRSANQYGLFAQVKEAGGEPLILGIARDNPKDTHDKILRGLRSDVLLISGGVSVGDFDLVPGMLKKLGVKIFFHKVAMQPGKPLIFGKKGKTTVFGLPGNPVSTMVCFYEFIRPCLLKMSGCSDLTLPKGEAVLDEDIKLIPKRTKFLRAKTFLKNGKVLVRLTSHQGSGNVLSLAQANCLLEVAEGVTRVPKGTRVVVEYLC